MRNGRTGEAGRGIDCAINANMKRWNRCILCVRYELSDMSSCIGRWMGMVGVGNGMNWCFET